MAKVKVTASQIFDALVERYGQSAVVVAEVPNATGFRRVVRRLDAVAVGCWPSRGLYFHGIEIKVSKADLRKELATPEKAEAIAQYCDQFYLACPAGLVDVDEIPEAWGLYEFAPGKKKPLRRVKEAVDHDPVEPDRRWIAALVRAVVQQKSDEAVIEKIRREERRNAWREAEGHYGEERERLIEDAKNARMELGRFKQAFSGWRYSETATVEKLSHIMKCIDSLRGNYGALNSLGVSARTVAEEVETIKNLAKGLFPEVEKEPEND